MATTADFKNGACIKHNGKLYQIVEFQHVKPGKGPAFVRTKIRNLENGRLVDNTFTAGVKIDFVRIERRPYQFLYKDENGYNIMHQQTFEQVSIPAELIDHPQFLREGMTMEAMVHAETEEFLSAEVPTYIEAEITYTEPGMKGNTATNTLKPATIDTGAEIRVPLFINNGDRIKVNTGTGEYSERV
ncbi:MAG: elongation factor P [Bacteroidetes bacterium]|nr:elongation factor P [Bacteroidota bacterium]